MSLINRWQSVNRSVKVEQMKSYVKSHCSENEISDAEAEQMNYLHVGPAYLQFVMLQCELHLL